MKEVSLSVVIIAKNAADVLKDCIESVSFADEIIVVDAGSSDTTVTLAKSLGARVVNGDSNDFSKQRMIGLRAASKKWILYVDTDERVSPMLAESIKGIVSSMKEEKYSAYKLQRKNFYLGKHEWPKVELLERLFLKEKLQGWHGKLHETPDVDGPIGVMDGFLLHFTHRNLASMLDKTIQWSQTEAKLRLDAHHPKIVTWRLVRVMLTAFWDSYIRQRGWKAGTMGLIESIYQSYSMFITYATLWEMQQSVKRKV